MIEVNNQINSKIDIKNLQKIGEKFLKYYKRDNFNVSVGIIEDRKMREINLRYRKINQTTDVLSFESSRKEKEDDKFLGEILINYKQIKRQAEEFKKEYEEELIFIFIHGMLHLIGYTDKTEKDRLEMINLANEFLKTC